VCKFARENVYKIIILISFCFILAVLVLTVRAPAYQRFIAHQIGPFDTLITFIGYAESEAMFEYYSNIVFGRLEELHRYYDIFNAYDGINNLYTINANAGVAPVAVNQDIIDLLLAAHVAYELTDGMVNVALGSVLRIWHEYRISNLDYATLPQIEALLVAAKLSDISHMVIDEDAGTVFLKIPGMSLDVGSIAKGFAAGLAMEAAAEAGMENMLLNAGGHIVAMGTPRERDAWTAGISNPFQTELARGGEPTFGDALSVTGASVSTSNNSFRFFTVDGQSFGHIIDPTTLYPAERFVQVVVMHEESWMADVLSTALFILPLEKGYILAEQTGAYGIWIDAEGVYTVSGQF